MRVARLALGSEEFIAPIGRSIVTDTKSNDQTFQQMAIVVQDIDEAFARLLEIPGIVLADATRGVFLGIDHCAVAVSETARSMPLYESLGLVVVGKSLDHGVEQAALSGVDGARIQVTGLAAPSGPGVEFLCYLEPGPAPRTSTTSGTGRSTLEWQTLPPRGRPSLNTADMRAQSPMRGPLT